jgi:hypothetical protein
LESFREEFLEPSTEREDVHRPPSQNEGLFPVSDPAVHAPAGLAPELGRSPFAFSSAGLGSRLDETRGRAFPEGEVPKPAIMADFAAVRRRRNRLLTLVGACLAVATSLAGWYSFLAR